MVFGTKKLFKGQHTIPQYQTNHPLWKSDWEYSRYSQMTISGRKDAKAGNFVFNYILETKSLHFITINGATIKIPKLEFPYGQEKIEQAIKTQWNMSSKLKKEHGTAIAWPLKTTLTITFSNA